MLYFTQGNILVKVHPLYILHKAISWSKYILCMEWFRYEIV